MATTWAPVVFWVLLVPLLIVMLIVYLRSKKFSKLVYILSVFTYAMTIMYWIDAYKLGRNAIVGLLVLSAILMMYLGKTQHNQKQKKTTTNKNIAITSLIIIGIITALSASPLGFNVTTTHAQQITNQDIIAVLEEGQPQYKTPGTPIYTVTITNKFIPRQYELPTTGACLYNSEKNAYQWANTQWDIGEQYSDFGPTLQTIELGTETKTATLKITQEARYKPMPVEAKPIKYEPEKYDTLYLFIGANNYVDCYNIQPQDMQKAIRIPVN